jgi:hypothetical protein
MDSMRGNYGTLAESGGYESDDDDSAPQAPPPAIGQDERRMQVRAYNHWASLLEDRNFPAIEDLEPDTLPDFGPYSVLLDFSTGIENPGVSYLGDKLAQECGIDEEELTTLADVPARSLLTRITDHYMQILANQAPIGFEAEFVNQRGATIAYRGILLPFSSDDDTIDFIYGVINWKELAEAQHSDELLLEIDQALEPKAKVPALGGDTPLTDWADGPGTGLGADAANDVADFGADVAALHEASDESGQQDYRAEEFAGPGFGGEEDDEDHGLPVPSFGLDDEEDDEPVKGPSFGSLLRMPIQPAKTPLELSDELLEPLDATGFAMPSEYVAPVEHSESSEYAASVEYEDETEDLDESAYGGLGPVVLEPVFEEATGEEQAFDEPMELTEEALEEEAGAQPTEVAEPAFAEPVLESAHAIDLPELDPSEMELGDWLAAAREMAVVARGSEERTREALYDAIGRAYDFSLAAAEAPAEFDELVADSGLTTQDRAPMTPVVKLVFGADYDKTRLTEYAAALTHAHRLDLPRGTLGDFLREAEGGLKGVVKAERRLRKEEAGKEVEPVDAPRHALAKKLRAISPQPFEAIEPEGSEFALVMIRRSGEGDVLMLGEVPEDVALIERAARRLVG